MLHQSHDTRNHTKDIWLTDVNSPYRSNVAIRRVPFTATEAGHFSRFVCSCWCSRWCNCQSNLKKNSYKTQTPKTNSTKNLPGLLGKLEKERVSTVSVFAERDALARSEEGLQRNRLMILKEQLTELSDETRIFLPDDKIVGS